jgi:ribonuclease-3
MPSQPDLAVLETTLGYEFRSREPLIRALTHKSWAYEQNSRCREALDNEQLEFLGDSVLGFLVSEGLLRRFPAYSEGQLSKMKSHLVSATHLHGVAQTLGLGAYLQLGRSEEMSGGREKKALLGDAVEAVLAAIYVDGGLERAREFVESHILPVAADADRFVAMEIPDYKSALKELAQASRLPAPKYVIISETGPEHAKVFTVEARLGREFISHAEGTSKKAAEQGAARGILQRLQADRNEP